MKNGGFFIRGEILILKFWGFELSSAFHTVKIQWNESKADILILTAYFGHSVC